MDHYLTFIQQLFCLEKCHTGTQFSSRGRREAGDVTLVDDAVPSLARHPVDRLRWERD